MDIVCLGELLVDMFPSQLGVRLEDVPAFLPKPGGAPANVAVAAARLGARTAFLGKVGEDAFGHMLAGVLRREGVDIRGLRFDAAARTTMAFVAMPNENTSEFAFYRNPGADMLLRADELDEPLLRSTCAYHFGSLSLTDDPVREASIHAARIARASGALISFDVNYRPSLWNGPEAARERILAVLPEVDLLKMNEAELELLAGSHDLEQGVKQLGRYRPKLIIVTLGAQGCYFQTAGGGGQVPGFRVRVVDATGCGDAFVAAVLWRLVAQGDWRAALNPEHMADSLRYANAVAAVTSLTRGVIPALPSAHRVQQFLADYDADQGSAAMS